MKQDRPSTTAEWVCSVRAAEQRRAVADRILDDPFALEFLSKPVRLAVKLGAALGRVADVVERLEPGLANYVLARHRAIDEDLSASLSAIRQIVILGAGYDSRAYRIAGSNRPVFEVDFPATSRRKRGIAESFAGKWPAADVRRVEVDFARDSIDEALIAAGFDREVPSYFVWEGVSMYLPRAAVRSTLETVRALSAPGSRLAVDFWFLVDAPDALSTVYRAGAGLFHLVGEPIIFGLHPEDAPGFFGRSGFSVERILDAKGMESQSLSKGRAIHPATYVLFARPVPASLP